MSQVPGSYSSSMDLANLLQATTGPTDFLTLKIKKKQPVIVKGKTIPPFPKTIYLVNNLPLVSQNKMVKSAKALGIAQNCFSKESYWVSLKNSPQNQCFFSFIHGAACPFPKERLFAPSPFEVIFPENPNKIYLFEKVTAETLETELSKPEISITTTQFLRFLSHLKYLHTLNFNGKPFFHGSLSPRSLGFFEKDQEHPIKFIRHSEIFRSKFHPHFLIWTPPEVEKAKNSAQSSFHVGINQTFDLWSVGLLALTLFSGKGLLTTNYQGKKISGVPYFEPIIQKIESEGSLINLTQKEIDDALKKAMQDLDYLRQEKEKKEELKTLLIIAHNTLKIDPTQRTPLHQIQRIPNIGYV